MASNYCTVAVGTETDGSITSPSAACSLVGLKPTVGLVSRSGIVPISHTQDTAGPMCRSVADAAVLLGVLAGADPRDPAVGRWWRAKADEIYRAIPDFGGFLVKANSEGQPGPRDYGATHADGANMLAAAESITSYLGLREDDVILDALPLAFDYGLYQVLMAARVAAS